MTSISRKPDDTTKTPIHTQKELFGHELLYYLNKALISHDDEKTLSDAFIKDVAEDMVYFINAHKLVQTTIDGFIVELNSIKIITPITKINSEKLKMIQLYIDVFNQLLRGDNIPKVQLDYRIPEISQILERLSSESLPKTPGGNKRKKKSNKNQSMRRKSNKNQSRKRKSRK